MDLKLSAVVVDMEAGAPGTGGGLNAGGENPPDPAGFAALLAGEEAPPLLADLDGEAAAAGGRVLPPGGVNLPLLAGPVNAGDSGAATDSARPAGTPADSLARLLRLVQALQATTGDLSRGTAGSSPAFSSGADLPRIELADLPRQLPPQIGAPSTAVPASASAIPAGEAAQPPAFPLNVPPGRPEWGNAVGERVLWMVANRVSVAQLRLNPPELGPVQVRVRLEDDGLRLSFAAGTSGAREALEAAAPRLREILMAEGAQLSGLDIEHREPGDHGRDTGESTLASFGESPEGVAEDPGMATPPTVRRAGLVDLFV